MTGYGKSELASLGQIVESVAQTEIMPRFERVTHVAAREKTSSFDVVTDADEQAEAAISLALRARFPRAIVIGEEASERDPTFPDLIAGADLAFIVDPLDGTRNFASGLPLFGVMVAVTIGGEVVAGVIHDPVRRNTAYALRGEGAWLASPAGDTMPLRVATAVPVAKMEGAIATNFLPEPLRTSVNSRLSRLGNTCWLRCAAHEYRLAASGKLHALFYNRLMPWDHAAGWLLHREAGGYAAHFDGTAYRPSDTGGGLICAPDVASYHALREALLG